MLFGRIDRYNVDLTRMDAFTVGATAKDIEIQKQETYYLLTNISFSRYESFSYPRA